MIRRQHKKSRKGCLVCKQRHIRCDEQRPTCLNCIRAERVCSYPRNQSRVRTPQDPSSHEPRETEGSCSNEPEEYQQDTNHDVINMLHLELMFHFDFNVHVPEFGGSAKESATKFVLQTALDAPFLMHAILAISAQHLSVTRPVNAMRYQNQAVELQTKAIELYNAACQDSGRERSVARLLFSSILGRHIISDVLQNNGLDFPSFLARYTRGVQIYRGVRAVAAEEDWSQLLGSDLGPIMTQGADTGAYDNLIELSDASWHLISNSHNLDNEEKTACGTALRLIETGFENLRQLTKIELGRRMIFMWSIMLPDLFISLLECQTPEAIAILGRYAMLLHFGRNIWQVREAGPHLLKAVMEFLGPTWDTWLTWPESLPNPLQVAIDSG
ncbi:hypothetical protein BU24DRAFT_441692 [Aaosphaeria arxii CBS 175.79]|uniref:Zn(2)-C6 fungal-type domain-containing protein n=1 Tax=Aaosphaeria arxii CBS 175.79 TaxID=1450172 RepID=A0A6A5XUR7_9PLEO|nr:uncharacterized protein BU24DRAFT_441692 [Aaosphaeria arxii CBS 175.79]KAF2016703.1 hypothetical protein BU24DRAFT_441692 [Aaosphaeria arxii CBS 175.79]